MNAIPAGWIPCDKVFICQAADLATGSCEIFATGSFGGYDFIVL